MNSIFWSAVITAIIREGYPAITGKELFPAKPQPRWLRKLLRRDGPAS